MSGSISIIMSNGDLSCPMKYLYFRLNQEKKKPNSTILKCRNNVSSATQVGREKEIAQQQQPLQYSSQPLAISPVGLKLGRHRFVVQQGRHPHERGEQYPVTYGSIQFTEASPGRQTALRHGPNRAVSIQLRRPVAALPYRCRAGRGVPLTVRCSRGAALAVAPCAAVP